METALFHLKVILNKKEFLKATIDKEKLMSKQRLEYVFKIFDLNGDGEISISEFKKILFKGMRQENEDVFKSLIDDINEFKKGQINFDDFCRMMSSIL
jgi:calcium-dependent protein kinase